MSRSGFTMVEMLVAVLLVGIVTVLSLMTFQAVTRGWSASTEYLDKVEMTDYAMNQLVSALRSSYYPREEKEGFGFFDPYEREGSRPADSDIIEWTKKGPAVIGSESVLSHTVHKVRVMVLEEGDTEDGDGDQFEEIRFNEPIKKTGLYARAFVDPDLASKDEEKQARVYYMQPTLIVEGVVGFRCRTLKEKPTADNGKAGAKGAYESKKLEEKYTDGKFPYFVELTLFIEKQRGGFLSRKERVPLVRVVRIPVYEQAASPK